MSDARGYVNARDNASTYRAMVESLELRDDLAHALDEAESALADWETQHETEYRQLFAQGEMAELNRLDAEWNVLEDDAAAAREAFGAWVL